MSEKKQVTVTVEAEPGVDTSVFVAAVNLMLRGAGIHAAVVAPDPARLMVLGADPYTLDRSLADTVEKIFVTLVQK